jgi:uncharacterized membrane protein
MHSASSYVLLRLIHIVAGVFWVGATLFLAAFLLPSLRGVGPAAGPVMEQVVQVRRLPVWMMSATILAILSGLALYGQDSAGFHSAWMHSGPGRVFGLGGLLGILAAGVGMAVNAPTGKRLGALAAEIKLHGGPPSPANLNEMQLLQAKLSRASNLVAILLVLATAAMAIARYM